MVPAPTPEGQDQTQNQNKNESQNQSQSQKEIILIVAEGCPHCEEVKRTLPDSSRGKIEVLDVTKSIRAAAILRDLGIYRVPVLVTVERTEQGTQLCGLDDKDMRVRCVRASEEAAKEPAPT
jgi:glutaredoxin